jgi:hypothetical protein
MRHFFAFSPHLYHLRGGFLNLSDIEADFGKLFEGEVIEDASGKSNARVLMNSLRI